MKLYGHKNMTDDQHILDNCFSNKQKVTENAFGIWLNRIRVFSVRNKVNKSNVSAVLLASVVLHNTLWEKSSDTYTPSRLADAIFHFNN